MAEYIEKEAAMLTPVLPKEHRRYQTSNLDDAYAQGWADALDNLKNAPADDVAPVVHGRWDLQRKGDWISVFVCSVCGRGETIAESGSYNSQLKMPKKYPYCHCGAKMDGGTENAAD